jgi:hypothetical protein
MLCSAKKRKRSAALKRLAATAAKLEIGMLLFKQFNC